MEMIIGGACQGKTQYAKNENPHIDWKSGTSINREELFRSEGVIGFHEFIRKELMEGQDVSTLAEELIAKNPEICLVSDEVGYGVVPVDAFDRSYREAVGRVCTKLAAYSKKVTRVVCGIGMVIKND